MVDGSATMGKGRSFTASQKGGGRVNVIRCCNWLSDHPCVIRIAHVGWQQEFSVNMDIAIPAHRKVTAARRCLKVSLRTLFPRHNGECVPCIKL